MSKISLVLENEFEVVIVTESHDGNLKERLITILN